MTPTMPLKLYRHALSGHSHRAHLALSLLGLPYELIDIDLKKGEHKTPEFIRMNPFGQLPVLDDNGVIVPDSNAILVYLAHQYDPAGHWLPKDARGQAAVQVWLSVAASQMAYGPASARRITVFGAKLDAQEVIARAHQLLQVMNGVLGRRAFLAGESATLADIAGYSYVSSAPEGNVDLSGYPNVRDWLARIEALPGFTPFQKTAVGLA